MFFFDALADVEREPNFSGKRLGNFITFLETETISVFQRSIVRNADLEELTDEIAQHARRLMENRLYQVPGFMAKIAGRLRGIDAQNKKQATAFLRPYLPTGRGEIGPARIFQELFIAHHERNLPAACARHVKNCVLNTLFPKQGGVEIDDQKLAAITNELRNFSQNIEEEKCKKDDWSCIAKMARECAFSIDLQRAGKGFIPHHSLLGKNATYARFVDVKSLSRFSAEEIEAGRRILKDLKRDPYAKKCAGTIASIEETLNSLEAFSEKDPTRKSRLYEAMAEADIEHESFHLAIVNLLNAYRAEPDSRKRESLARRMLHYFPRDFEGYEAWKGTYTLTGDSTLFWGTLKENHQKLLALYGEEVDWQFLQPPHTRPILLGPCPAPKQVMSPHAVELPQVTKRKRPPRRFHSEKPSVQEKVVWPEQDPLALLRQERAEREERFAALAKREALKASAKAAKAVTTEDAQPFETVQSSAESASESTSGNGESTVLRTLARGPHQTFLNFFQNKQGEIVDLSEPDQWVNTTWQDLVRVSVSELTALVTALGGTVETGKGRHQKATLPAMELDNRDFSVFEMIDPTLGSQTATLAPKEGFIPPYQIEQLRNKLMALGYTPSTIKRNA